MLLKVACRLRHIKVGNETGGFADVLKLKRCPKQGEDGYSIYIKKVYWQEEITPGR